MAYRAKIVFDGQERDLLYFSIDFFKPRRSLSDIWQGFTGINHAPPVFETLYDLDRSSPFITAPKGEPVGGLLNFVMESTDDDNVFYNSMETTRIANGVVEVYHALEDDYPLTSTFQTFSYYLTVEQFRKFKH